MGELWSTESSQLTRQIAKGELEYFDMSSLQVSRQTELAEKLRLVDQQLRSEMIARGFDPAQDDNLALTGPLAKLYMERETLRAELESLANKTPVEVHDIDHD